MYVKYLISCLLTYLWLYNDLTPHVHSVHSECSQWVTLTACLRKSRLKNSFPFLPTPPPPPPPLLTQRNLVCILSHSNLTYCILPPSPLKPHSNVWVGSYIKRISRHFNPTCCWHFCGANKCTSLSVKASQGESTSQAVSLLGGFSFWECITVCLWRNFNFWLN